MSRVIAAICAAASYFKKAREGLPWKSGHVPSQPGGWFHHQVNEWVENVRGEPGSPNTRLWACFLAFVCVTEFVLLIAAVVIIAMWRN